VDVETIDNKIFIKPRKKDSKVKRLLLSEGSEKVDGDLLASGLSRSNVVEQLKELKDQEWLKRLGNPKEKERRYSNKLRVEVLKLPECVEIDAPTILDVPGRKMVVKLNCPRKCVSVELTSENLEYLSKSILCQVGASSIKREANVVRMPIESRKAVIARGVYNSYSTKRPLRAVHKDWAGKRSYHYTSCEDAARLFVQTGKRPKLNAEDEQSDGHDESDEESEESGEQAIGAVAVLDARVAAMAEPSVAAHAEPIVAENGLEGAAVNTPTKRRLFELLGVKMGASCK
jgi:hypothetical protein